MRARRLTLSTFIAAITLGLLTLATPAVAAGPAPAAGQPEAYILIDEGLVIFDPALAVVSLRYACYGDPTTMDVTATVGGVQASGSVSIPCQGVLELGTQVQLRVPEKAPQFSPGTYDVAVHASIPGQATLDTTVKDVVGPAASSAVVLDSFVSPAEVAKGRKITITGNVRTGGFEAPTALKLALEFRPDGGAWGKLKTVRSDADGRVETKVKARTSGNFRLRFAGSATLDPATSYPNYVLVRPKPKKYKSCTALNKVYKHGVGRSGATEVGLGVKSWTRITPTYDKNSKLDLDKDGVACEKV